MIWRAREAGSLDDVGTRNVWKRRIRGIQKSMLKSSRNKRNFNPARIADGVPKTLAHGAEDAGNRLAGAAEEARSSQESLAGVAGEAGNRLAGAAGQASNRLADAVENTSAHVQPRRFVRRSARKARTRLTPSSDAILKAQLVKTSRELARESSDLGSAVDSLNSIIKANRKASAKGRTRLIGGVALGAGLMYHLDAEHGRQRRAATARLLGISARRDTAAGH